MYIINIVEHLSEMSLNFEGKILKCVSKTLNFFTYRNVSWSNIERYIYYKRVHSDI